MTHRWLVILALLALGSAGCQTTPERKGPVDKARKAPLEASSKDKPDIVTIRPDELEPVRRFVLQTRRVVAAEFVRIEMTSQFFEQQFGYTRDLRHVDRKMWTLADGTRVIELTSTNKDQVTNLDPNLLPRVYFGPNGLEVRAFRTMRIYLLASRNKDRSIYLDIRAKNSVGDVHMWVTGRKQHEKPTLHIRSELIWSEDSAEYKHRTSIG